MCIDLFSLLKLLFQSFENSILFWHKIFSINLETPCRLLNRNFHFFIPNQNRNSQHIFKWNSYISYLILSIPSSVKYIKFIFDIWGNRFTNRHYLFRTIIVFIIRTFLAKQYEYIVNYTCFQLHLLLFVRLLSEWKGGKFMLYISSYINFIDTNCYFGKFNDFQFFGGIIY